MQTQPHSVVERSFSQPLVSFIITDYNLPTTLLRQCVESILALSLRKEEREIILIDDGSDASPLEQLSDLRHLIIYIRQDNRGPSAARNTGLRIATGRYVQFVDGDDLLLRPAYEHCLDIVRYHDPDMVLFQLTDRRATEVPLTLAAPITGSQYMRNNNVRASVCCYIFARKVLGELRLNEALRTQEDEEFTPQLLLRAEKVFPTDARAYFYRKRRGSSMNSKGIEHTRQRLANHETVIYRLQDILDTLPDTDKPALNRRIAQLTMDYLYNIMRLTHDNTLLEQAISRLEARGLFPLPDKDYTKKYRFFRKVINSKHLRRLATTVMIG